MKDYAFSETPMHHHEIGIENSKTAARDSCLRPGISWYVWDRVQIVPVEHSDCTRKDILILLLLLERHADRAHLL